MIDLGNGHKMDFACASGALAFRGEGWWFEKFWFHTGYIKSKNLTIITKSLTRHAVAGNLRHYCPWRAVRPIIDNDWVIYWVNAVAFTNPGYEWWCETCYPYMVYKGYKVVANIAPDTEDDLRHMLKRINLCHHLVGIELNVSCPNVAHISQVKRIVDMTKLCVANSHHPIILKLGVHQPYIDVCRQLNRDVAAFDLINSVPWNMIFMTKKSPLSRYGYSGGVSGAKIRSFAREALLDARHAGVTAPILSVGSVDSFNEVDWRLTNGADAVGFGTIYMTKPWLPESIINQWRNHAGDKVYTRKSGRGTEELRSSQGGREVCPPPSRNGRPREETHFRARDIGETT